MQRIFQAAAWLLAATIVVLSLGPHPFGQQRALHMINEHLLILLATGMTFELGYPRRFWLLTICAANIRGCDRGYAKLGSRFVMRG
jgi:hypothetical protein